MLAIGILLQGVMEDYKEAERLPAGIANVFDSLAERVFFLAACDARAAHGGPPLDARALHAELLDLLTAVFEFLAGLRSASEVTALTTGTGLFLADAAARVSCGGDITWEIWQSVEHLRAHLLRQAVIRRTEFLPAGSMLIKGITYTIIGLYVCAIYTLDSTGSSDAVYYGTVYVSIAVNTALFTYLLFLAEDLDDPFEYSLASLTPAAAAAADLGSAAGDSDEIDTFPLLEVFARLAAYAGDAAALGGVGGARPRVSALAAALAAARPGAARAPSALAAADADAPPGQERRAFRRLLAASMRAALGGSVGEGLHDNSVVWHAPREREVSGLRRFASATRACCARGAALTGR